ncbi:MAG: hypothetical protein A3G87_02150 [Omnitrophica bacterium RIFCSPLOWO2_12_FULL_50_11]|nr:MAG: hypothetical protein A3G87_02150 [Omnitrophica bacterium RIFCSPLOWO2_12_FULL_50_11]
MFGTMNVQNVQWGLKGLEDVINIHPLFVHFPVALILTSVAFYFLGSIFRKDELFVAGKWVLYFGTLAAAITVWTGLQAEKTVPHGGGTHDIMMVHQYFGFVVLGLSLILSLWVLFSKTHIPPKGRIFFLIGLVLVGLILIQGADLGGRLVFLNGVGVGRKSMLEETSSHEHGDHEHSTREHAGHEHGGRAVGPS